MENIVLAIHLILAASLIIAVLLQRSEGGGLGIGGGGGAMSGRAPTTAVQKLTWIIAIGFLATSISLTIIGARNAAGSSVIDRVGIETTEGTGAATPALPGLTGDLTPTLPNDAPVTPPAAD